MVMKQADWKEMIGAIGEMMDARLKTFGLNLKSELKEEIREELRRELKATEDRIRKDMATKDDIKNMATKQDIKDMATKQDIKDMATRQDIQRLEEKIEKKDKGMSDRLEAIENELALPHVGNN